MKRPSDDDVLIAMTDAGVVRPTPDSWGFYEYADMAPAFCGSGIGSLVWFGSRKEMLDFVRDTLAWWRPGPSSATPEEIAERVHGILDQFDLADESPEMMKDLRRMLNKAMKYMWQIGWWGTLKELMQGKAVFPRDVRERFWSQQSDDPDQVCRKPIDELRQEEFIGYLSSYGH